MVVLFISLSAAAIAGVSDKFAGGETKDTGQMDVTSADRAFGGARNAAVEETNISLSSGGAGAIFGGGLSEEGDSGAAVKGLARLNIDAGTVEDVAMGGGVAEGDDAYAPVGDVRIAMGGEASVNGTLLGGGMAQGVGARAPVSGDVNIEITSGSMPTTAHVAIAGGGSASAPGNGINPPADIADATVHGNTSILISGGNFGSGYTYICGGGAGESFGRSDVKGNASVTIEGGAFNNTVVMGGGMIKPSREYSSANVGGDTFVILSGDKALGAAAGIVELRGGGLVYGTQDNSSAKVAGTKHLVLNGVGEGTIASTLYDVDILIIKGECSVALTNPSTGMWAAKKVRAEGKYMGGEALLTLTRPTTPGQEMYWPAIDESGSPLRWDKPKNLLVAAEIDPTKWPDYSEDIENALSADVSPLLPVIPPTVASADELLPAFASADFDTGDGYPRLSVDVVLKAAKGEKFKAAFSLPVFTANLPADKTVAACAFVVSSADLLAEKAGAVNILKVKSPTEALSFKYSADVADLKKGGCFTIQKDGDKAILAADAPLTDNRYKVTLFIKDNDGNNGTDAGKFDLDPAQGKILDPCAIVGKKTEPPTPPTPPTPPSGGSSGGCSAGAFALAALLGGALLVFKEKR